MYKLFGYEKNIKLNIKLRFVVNYVIASLEKLNCNIKLICS